MFRHREDFRIQNLKPRNYSGYKIHASDVINHTTQRITTSAETVFSDCFFTGSSAAFAGVFFARDCRNRTTRLAIATKVQENAHFPTDIGPIRQSRFQRIARRYKTIKLIFASFIQKTDYSAGVSTASSAGSPSCGTKRPALPIKVTSEPLTLYHSPPML